MDDPSEHDIQPIKLTLTITAAVGTPNGIRTKAKEAGVNWYEEKEDFKSAVVGGRAGSVAMPKVVQIRQPTHKWLNL
jgi:hypothetical protein